MAVYYPECRVVLQVVFENFGDLDRPLVFPVQAQQVTVYANSYREADTFSVTFDAKDLPFSPELIRAMAAEVYIFNRRSLPGASSAVTKGLDDALGLGAPVQPSIAGLVDSADMEWSEDGRQFSIDGRDYTSLFLDKQWDPNKRVKTGRTLDATLRDLMAEVPGARSSVTGGSIMSLVVETGALGALSSLPVVGQHDGKQARSGIQYPKGSNYWEVMQALALRYGFILFVRGLNVVLTTPKTFIAGKTDYRKLAWGRNISTLGMRRKIGKERVPIVEVSAWDDKAMRTLKASFPERGDKVNDKLALGTDKDVVKQFALQYPVRSLAQLRQIAETVFYQIARAELTVNVETSELEDLEGSDLVELRAGDAVAIKFDLFNESIWREFTTDGERIGYLLALGYSAQVAQVVTRNAAQVEQLREPMRVREATIEWSADGGINLSMELIQFVQVGAVPGASA